MIDGQPDTLEHALARTEADADVAIKAATSVLGALRRFRGAARQGKIRELETAIEAARASLRTLDQAVENATTGWDFDEEEYLRSGRFSEELIARAERAGVRISPQDNRLYCYPVLLRVLPSDRAVLLDKTRERRLPPGVLVDVLKETQKRPPRFRPAEFLQSLYGAYQVIASQKPGRSGGDPVVPLLELYELLTLLPGQSRDYSRQEFARDVYLLDQSGETAVRNGARLEFHASTGTRLARGTLSVVAQDGREKRYWGISFTAPAGD
jgi:hypothetical protein